MIEAYAEQRMTKADDDNDHSDNTIWGSARMKPRTLAII